MGAKQPVKREVDFSKLSFPRLAHNYFTETRGGDYSLDDLNVLNGYVNYLFEQKNQNLPKYKVGIMLVCINPPYWQYAEPVIQGVKNLFLPDHDTEVMLWSDVENYTKITPQNDDEIESLKQTKLFWERLGELGVKTFNTESVEWPYPTLMRYHLFLGEEEYLKKFDYIFYLDLDMRIVNIVGDEILGNGLTAAQHPMYALDRKFVPPYEPNPASASYIPRPGRVLSQDGGQMFQPLYFAGGFQGGKTPDFLKAMKETKALIDKDLDKGYIPIWNDESAWNRYLFENPPSTVLNPSYIYPDSMINEYYIRIWGRNYPPKIVTLTKPFTTTSEGGEAAQQMIGQLSGL